MGSRSDDRLGGWKHIRWIVISFFISFKSLVFLRLGRNFFRLIHALLRKPASFRDRRNAGEAGNHGHPQWTRVNGFAS